MTSHNSFDDLPSRTTEHVGEEDSARRFRELFRDPYFIVREEGKNDYGVDVVIEALLRPDAPSNIRAHAQLKASSQEPNADNSYSYSVDRTNLNYLLRSPGSFYAYYVRPNGPLLYRSADDVLREYEEKNDPKWETQKTITVRFKDELDTSIVKMIHALMIAHGRWATQLRP